MKFENLYIECENLEQRDEVFGVCRGEGLIFQGVSRDDELVVRVMEGCFFSMYWEPSEDAKNISYQEFISKYGKSKMKQSIEKAMAELNMGREELSSALGMSRPYITKMLTRPQSEKTQAEVIWMIDELMQSGGAKNIPIPDSTEKFLLKGIVDARDKTIKDLNQALEYKDQLLAKNEDDLHKATNRANSYKEDNSKLKENIDYLVASNNEKDAELLAYEKLTTDLSNQVEILKRKNEDINIYYSIVCVILTALVVWGFYV